MPPISADFNLHKRTAQKPHHFGLTVDPGSIRTCGGRTVSRFRESHAVARILGNELKFAWCQPGVLHVGAIARAAVPANWRRNG